MRTVPLFILTLTNFCGFEARAQTPPEAIVWEALVEINQATSNPEDPTNRPPLIRSPPAGMIRAVDLSNDGKPDWLVDYSNLGMAWCGTGGCLHKLYVSTPDGYARVFDRQAFTLAVAEKDGEARLEAWVHDLHCERQAGQCRFAWAWDTANQRLIERPVGKAIASARGGAFPPVVEGRNEAPEDCDHPQPSRSK